MQKTLFLALLLCFTLPAYSDSQVLEAKVSKAGSRSFEKILFPDGRVCQGCSIVTKGGYITEVIHPSEGSWPLTPGKRLMFEMEIKEVADDRRWILNFYDGPDRTSPFPQDIPNLQTQDVVQRW